MRPLLVFVGPSGAGKSTLARQLSSRGQISLLPTWTTRPRRQDEGADTPEHLFVSDSQMDAGLKSGAVVHCMPLFGLPFRYGLPRLVVAQSGPVTALMGRAHLLPYLQRFTNKFIVYQFEASLATIQSRLRPRVEAGIDIGTRLELFSSELELGWQAAHRVFSTEGDPNALVAKVITALNADYPGG